MGMRAVTDGEQVMTIPVTRSYNCFKQLQQYGMPIVLVDEWADITPALLERVRECSMHGTPGNPMAMHRDIGLVGYVESAYAIQEWDRYKDVLGRARWIGTVEGVESLYYQTCD
eukprot:scaffold909_cov575-Prasinococcus_capsulatus_cf.AAC.6